MRKRTVKKMMSMLLVSSMAVVFMAGLSGCGKNKNNGRSSAKNEKKEIVTLEVFNYYGSYTGMQEGWMADILKKKFNVKLEINAFSEDEYQTRLKKGDLGDILILGEIDGMYANAVKKNLLYDWNRDSLLEKHGSYIKENMQDALRKNQEITSAITDGSSDALYGFGSGLATSSKDHEPFFYTWDVRWDLYKQLGYPKVNNLEDYEKLLKDMVKICPKDDSGNKTYAASLWSEWDESMAMYVKAMASAYYGYDELGMGLYDPKIGKWHGALEKDGSYLEMLKFFNRLYQSGLLDPDSRKQTYEEAINKVKNGGTLSSILDYAGSAEYNVPKHTKEGKMMHSMKPAEASPIVYGIKTGGENSILCIGAASKHPEKCMEVINWLSTPEGYMTTQYGPKGVCWKYNDEKKTELTKLGKKCQEDSRTEMPDGHHGSFMDGMSHVGNGIWALDASNPETDGETYNKEFWESSQPEPETEIEKDWREKTDSLGADDYLAKGKYTISPGTDYDMGEKSKELKKVWKKVSKILVRESWNAIYAETDTQYDKIVAGMISKCTDAGYAKCVKWSKREASKRKALEDALMR